MGDDLGRHLDIAQRRMSDVPRKTAWALAAVTAAADRSLWAFTGTAPTSRTSADRHVLLAHGVSAAGDPSG
jgi:hypothetical protein